MKIKMRLLIPEEIGNKIVTITTLKIFQMKLFADLSKQ